MSAYISFWIRANSGGPYLCLNSYSRSSKIYQAMEHQVSYGTFKELAGDMLREGIELLEGSIQLDNESIQDNEAAIKFLQGVAHFDAGELEEKFFDYRTTLAQLREEIKESEFAIAQLRTFWQILDEQEYGDNTGKLYCSHECNPNYREDNENEENQF